MMAVFHTSLCGIFIEIQSNLSGKKLHRTTKGSSFLVGIFSNKDNIRAPIQFRRESQPQHPKILDQLILTSIAPVLLDQSSETSLVFPTLKSTSTSCHSPQGLLKKDKASTDWMLCFSQFVSNMSKITSHLGGFDQPPLVYLDFLSTLL